MNQNIIIEEELVQEEARAILNRKLSTTEYEEVTNVILENLGCYVQGKIDKVIEFNRLLKRNRGANKLFPHYTVYHRNINAYQPEFNQIAVFKNETDARDYIHYDFITEYDEWLVVRIDEKNKKKDVYKINC